MKSLVCNVFGMALGVACLALCLQRCSFADEQPAPPEQKQEQTQVQEQVVVVQSDDGKSTEVQKQVIVVTTDDENTDAADTLKKALHRRLEKLPAEIQEKIKHKLQAAKEARDAKKKEVQVEVIAVGSDGEAGTTEQSASQTQHTATVVAKAFPEGAEKHAVIAVAVDGKELSGDDKVKTFTVTMKDGKVVVNDKPVDAPGLDCVKCGTITLVVKADAETGAVRTEVKTDDDQAPKAEGHKVMILSGDGQTKMLNFDVDSNVHGMAFGEGHMQLEGVAEGTTAKEGTYTFTIVGDKDGKSADGVHKIQMRAVKAQAVEGKPAVGVITVSPGTGMPHGALMNPALPGAKVHADFAKRLKGIESELKQIRKLLEEMQKEDADK